MGNANTAPAITPASVAAMSNRELNETLLRLLRAAHGVIDIPSESIYVRAAPYSTDPAAAESALKAIEALGWEWSTKGYHAENHGGASGERRYLMIAQKVGLGPVYADTITRERAVAECATLALAAMREER